VHFTIFEVSIVSKFIGLPGMDIDKSLPYKLLEDTVGIAIEIISNDFQEMPAYGGSVNTYQKIVFQITEEEPDLYAIGVLYTLSLMSF
jgi:hypothetical protein